MKPAAIGLAAGLAWYGAAAATSTPPATQERWNWSGSVATGRTVEIRGISGSIIAEAASGNRVEVTADKHGRRSDPDDVRIEVVEHAGGVTICAVYPDSRRGQPNTCEAGGGRSNTGNNDVEVNFRVRVPRGLSFIGANVNGDVEAIGLSGRVEVTTVNGGVRLETSSGEARATTVNGSINATVRATGDRDLRFTTVNGSISLRLPEGVNADFSAETVNGSISSDFPVTVQGRMNPRRLNGRIGNGGREIELRTVNGSIRLLRL
jgi:hypothetical protein